MNRKLSLIASAAGLALLAGCTSPAQHAVQADSASTAKRIAQGQDDFKSRVDNAQQRRVAAQIVNRPFIAGNAQPLARDMVMPDQLRRSVPVTALFSSSAVDLETALDQLSQASGILLTATPDALMPASGFMPRTTTATGAPSAGVGAPPRLVLKVENRPLWKTLDDIARQTQTSWRPMPSGAEFYRVETRVFPLSAIHQMASSSASLGRNGGGSDAFESKSKSSFEVKDMNVLNGFKVAVEAMMTTGGKLTVNNESASLIVTDTPQSLARIDDYIKDQNKILSRRVRLMLEAIEVVDKDASELGVDWSLIYNKANAALSMASPGTLTGNFVGNVGYSATNGRFSGSSVVVNALSEVGTVVNRRVFPLLTTSGRPVTHAIRSTFNYVDEVQATTSSGINTSTQAPTVTQKDETVGTFLTVVPTAKPDGTIFLSMSYDVTSAQPLVPFTVGSEGSSVTVQQKTIDGSGVIQEVPIKSGQSFVVGGLETMTGQDTIRRLLPGAPLLMGGSNATKMTKTRMVLIVTAVIEDSGN